MATRELARQLGVIETPQYPTSRKKPQTFNYLLVLDFEATCWPKSDSKKGPSEIIEFPVVLYDLKKKKIVEEFQQYVKPEERPILSDFCMNLTGISQRQVNEGVSIKKCLILFNEWINNNLVKYQMSFPNQNPSLANKCVFLTWTDWDLGECLIDECHRKSIQIPSFFHTRIDLRRLYRLFYQRNPMSLKRSLNQVGLNFEGREHCGLHDARNTARLAAHLVAEGEVLRITNTFS